MLKWFGPIVVLLALFAVSCNDDDDGDEPEATSPAATEAAADGPQTYDVQVDGNADDYNAGFIAYFPNAVTVHAGDTVRFSLVDTLGEGPHTVTFGAHVDALMKVISDFCGPEGLASAKCADEETEPPVEFDAANMKLPALLPEGPGDANQAAANPCFLDSGDAPAEGACPEREQPDFDGTQTLYNSGWMSPDDDFTVKLADDLAPGGYTWICLLHNVEMTGTLTVTAESEDRDTPDEVDARGEAELDTAIAALQPGVDAVRTSTAENALAGNYTEESRNGAILELPEEITIPVGGTVTWSIVGAHTVSFNAPESANKLRIAAPDGTVHINEESVSPAGWIPPEAPEGEEPPPGPILLDAGSYDGEAFLSSGLQFGDPSPEGTVQFKITFTQAGTYTYKCLIHEKMEGTIKVGS